MFPFSHAALSAFQRHELARRVLEGRQSLGIENSARAHVIIDLVMINDRRSSSQSGEGDIRRALIEADLMDWMVASPASYSTVRRFLSASGSSQKTKKTKMRQMNKQPFFPFYDYPSSTREGIHTARTTSFDTHE